MPRFEDDNLNLPAEDYVPMGGAGDDDDNNDEGEFEVDEEEKEEPVDLEEDLQ